MLIVFSGLPGTGKTTIARALAARYLATYLRIDEIEQAMRTAGVLAGAVGSAGYIVASALAASNLRNDCLVIADCVNPVHESREGWRRVAAHAQKPLLEIETICSDQSEHRHRVEDRRSDIDGLTLPTWQSVIAREYAPWPEPHLVLDTSVLAPHEAVAIVEKHINRCGQRIQTEV